MTQFRQMDNHVVYKNHYTNYHSILFRSVFQERKKNAYFISVLLYLHRPFQNFVHARRIHKIKARLGSANKIAKTSEC